MANRLPGVSPFRQIDKDNNFYTFSVNGPVLNAPKGSFVCVWTVSTDHPTRPTRDLTAVADSGLVVISARPGDKTIARRIDVIRATLEAKQKLTRVIAQQYQEAYDAAIQGKGYVLGVRGLFSIQQGKTIPPGSVPSLAIPLLLMRPLNECSLLFSPSEKLVQEALIPPSHSGYGVNPVLVGYSLEGMAQYVSLGGEQNAAHIVFLGRTRSGKSTLVKNIIRQIVDKYGGKMRVVVADVKGEYLRKNESLDGTVSYDTLVPSATVIGKRDFPPIGWRVLRCTKKEDAHTEALYESRMANNVLEILGLPPQPKLTELLMKAWKQFMEEGGTPELRPRYQRAIYKAVSADLPPESVATVLFGGNGKLDRVHHAVIDLGWAAFNSPDQRAAFLWGVSALVPLFGASAFRRTVMLLEEFQLLPPELLDTILRVCGGKGVSTLFVTQAYKQVEQLGGAGKQFSAAIIMAPQISEVHSISRTIFEMDASAAMTSMVEAEIRELGSSKSYGWGVIVSPVYGVNAAVVELAPQDLHKIEEFNVGNYDRRGISEDQGTI